MTTEQLSKLSPEEKRVLIAEACGWTDLRFCGKLRKLRGRMPSYPNGSLCKPPDYLNDLNAMHEAEKTLAYGKLEEMHGHLASVVASWKPRNRHTAHDFLWHATAAQRADAFLLLLP